MIDDVVTCIPRVSFGVPSYYSFLNSLFSFQQHIAALQDTSHG
jgi:hypothetical protein